MKTKNSHSFNRKNIAIVSALFGIGLVLLNTSTHTEGILSKFTRSDITSSNAAQYWTPSGTLNPYFSKLSATHSNQLDQLTLVILGKGKNLSNENFIVYLSNLNKGLGVISKKPNYAQDVGVQNIVGYLSYEIGSTIGALTQTVSSTISNTGTTPNTGAIQSLTTTTIRNSTTSTHTPAIETAFISSLSIPELKYGANGYEPVKIGKTITIQYETVGIKSCKGWYAKAGETQGYEVQFSSLDVNGNSQGGNSTTLSSGSFNIAVNYPIYLEFTCISNTNKEVKKTINLLTKLHDESDTYIELDKETIGRTGETVALSWQSSVQSNWKYCHILKTHSSNGKKGDPTVILESGIELSRRKSGVITDTIQKSGDYVYVLNCNDSQNITPDLYNGASLSSKLLSLAGPVEAPVIKTASGVPYSQIKEYIDAVIASPGTDKEKAQMIFNQMGISQVTEEDIFNAYAGALTRADISGYLAKRNESPVATPAPVQITNPITQKIQTWLQSNPQANDTEIRKFMDLNAIDVWQMSEATGISREEITRRYNAATPYTSPADSSGAYGAGFTPPPNTTTSGVPYSQIKEYIDAVIASPGTDKEKAQMIFNQMGISQVTEEDIFNAYAGALTRADISGYLARR